MVKFRTVSFRHETRKKWGMSGKGEVERSPLRTCSDSITGTARSVIATLPIESLLTSTIWFINVSRSLPPFVWFSWVLSCSSYGVGGIKHTTAFRLSCPWYIYSLYVLLEGETFILHINFEIFITLAGHLYIHVYFTLYMFFLRIWKLKYSI